MAKILFGAGVGDARGSVGAITFSKGRNGAILRAKVSPVQPRNGRTQNVRGQFGTLAKLWSGVITGGEHAGWNALAEVTTFTNVFGNSYKPTGMQLYMQCNRNLDAAGAAHIADAPANLSVTGLLTITVTCDSDPQTFSVAYTATPAAAGHHVLIAASVMYPPGRSSFPVNTVQMHASAAAAASPANILAAYQTRYGLLKAGTKIKVEVWTVNSVNGAKSTPLTTIVDVA